GVGTGSTSVTVNNVAPVVDPIGVDFIPGVRGETLTFTDRFTDVGTLDTHTVTWNFDDGTGDLGPAGAAQGTTLTYGHVFADSGTYTVSLTVRDDDGGVTVVSKQVTIVAAALQADPLSPGQTMLVVGGTTGDDTVVFTPSGSTGGVQVIINGVS